LLERQPFRGITPLLKNVPKPVTLVFLRRGCATCPERENPRPRHVEVVRDLRGGS
jgi:hypothetical protein